MCFQATKLKRRVCEYFYLPVSGGCQLSLVRVSLHTRQVSRLASTQERVGHGILNLEMLLRGISDLMNLHVGVGGDAGGTGGDAGGTGGGREGNSRKRWR